MSSRSHKVAVGLAVAVIVTGLGSYVAYNEGRARQRGFADWSEQSTAQRSGITTGSEWRQKVQSDARRREEETAEEARQQALAVEEKQRKDRAALFEMLRAVDKTPFWQKKSYASLKEAYGVINDFKLADNLMIAAMEKEPSAQERRLIETIQQKVAAGRRASYPFLRAAFGQFAQEMLHSDGFRIRVVGTRNEILNVYNKSFALSQSIQTAHEKILEYLQDFNFQRACYALIDAPQAKNSCYPSCEHRSAVVCCLAWTGSVRARLLHDPYRNECVRW